MATGAPGAAGDGTAGASSAGATPHSAGTPGRNGLAELLAWLRGAGRAGGAAGGVGASPPTPGAGKAQDDDDRLTVHKVIEAFRGLPRVVALVWRVSPWLTLALGALYTAQGFTPLATALVSGLLIDGALRAVALHGAGGSTIYVFWLVVAQFGVQGVNSLLTTFSNIAQQLLQERMSYQVQLMVMEKANTLDLAFFENPTFYDRLQEAQSQAASRPIGMISETFGLGRTIITLLSMVVLLSQLAWWLSIVAVVAPIPAFVANVRYGWWGYRMMRRQSPLRREMSYYNTLLTTDIYNKEIKLFTLGAFFIGMYHKIADQFLAESRRLLVPRYLAAFGWGLGTLLVNGVIYLYVVIQTIAGVISFGRLTVFTQAALSLGTSFQGILSGVSDTYENNLYVKTLFEYLAYQPAIVSPPDGVAPGADGLTIEFRDVSFTYPGASKGQALHNVSFAIHPGESIALVGRNGAGKTTIVKLLTRLYDPDSGEILINGRDIKTYDLAALRSQIGVIFQDYVTYFLNASRNIGVGKIEAIDDDAGVRVAATKSGAHAVIERLPNSYATMLGKWFDQGQQLSGGEWQKIALARAFMRDAQLLILDEPTSSLDPQAEYDVFRRFRELTAGKSAIFISHRFSTVRLANRIVVLEDGCVIEEGSHAELLARDGRYAELFRLQAEAYQ